MAISLENCDGLSSDEEPKLKYSRMGNDVQLILLKDAVSCICVHTKFICLGTQWGIIHLLDHDGNTVPIFTNSGKSKEFRAHSIAVNWISVDENGEYIASCSDDGKVIVHGLYTTENSHSFTVPRIIKSIALDKQYYKSGSGRKFLTGDNNLTLYEKTFLNRLKSTVLCECEGYVQKIAWQGRFIAWASEVGVRIYDIVARCSLGLIQWEKTNVSIENFPCSLLWSDNRTLMIGWVDTVRICVIRKRSSIELVTRDVTEYLVDPVYTFQTDYHICGLGPLDDQLVILGLPKDKDPETDKSQRPILVIADYKTSEFTEVSTDSLNIRGYEEYNTNDYHLSVLLEENRFFIVSPKDIVIASPCDINDKINWLMEHKKFQKAISTLEEYGGKTSAHTVATVGIQYLDYMLSAKLYKESAELCAKICNNDRCLWEGQVKKFAEVNQLRAISRYLPSNDLFRLNPQIYELTLHEYIKVDSDGFLKLIKEWNPSLYRTSVVINATMEHLLRIDENKDTYLEALAILYTYEKKYDKALTMYLKLQHKDVFKLIKIHNMYHAIHDKILALMTLDCDRAITLLLDKKTKIPTDVVQKQLDENDLYLYKYLDAYCKVEPHGHYHGRLVRLYAKFDRKKLLPFLKSNDNYPIQDALDVCQSKKFYPEMVFLLGRIGNTKEALQIIIEQLKDINQAIIFCQEHNDKELWMDLINKSVDNPEYVTLLLQRIGNYVDPRMLIQGIKPACVIDGLKDSLAKMMSDYCLQLSVKEACKDITLKNYFDLHERLVKGHGKGISVTDEFFCCICQGKILIKDLTTTSDLIIYNCRHSFHLDCVADDLNVLQNCIVCNAVKL